MRRWTSTIEIEAPSERVWTLIAGFEHWPEWGLSIRQVEPTTGRVAAKRRGRVRSAIGVWVPFEITAVEEGRSWNWKVAGIDATGHRVAPTPGGCNVTFTAPGWAPFYVPVLAISLRRLRLLAQK